MIKKKTLKKNLQSTKSKKYNKKNNKQSMCVKNLMNGKVQKTKKSRKSRESRKTNISKNTKKIKSKKIIKYKPKNYQKGGAFLQKRKARMGQLIDDVKKCEKKFLKQHQKYAKESDLYFKLYNEHIKNLKELDEAIPRLDSFVNIFNDIVMPKEIKPKLEVPKHLPLLINQYNISEFSSPRDIGIEHIRQQVKYCMLKNFLPQDLRIITDVIVELNPSSVELTFIINGFKKLTHTVQHTGFQIDLSSLKFIIESILEEVKDNIEYEFGYKPPPIVKEKDEVDEDVLFKISPDFKTKPKTKKIEVVGQAQSQGQVKEIDDKGIIEADDQGLKNILNLMPGNMLEKNKEED